MRKQLLASTSVVALLTAGAFGFAGTAEASLAQELLNPGAEEDGCSITHWMTSGGDAGTVEGVEEVNQSNGTVLPRSGSCFFSMAGQADTSAAMYQDVDVTSCSAKYLAGRWEASGWIQTEDPGNGSDEGELEIAFDVGPTSTSSGLTFPRAGGASYGSFDDDGDVPYGATTATYTLRGFLNDGSFLNVFYDDLFFGADCVVDFAKISGRKGGTKQSGTRGTPTWTFASGEDGAIGTLENAGPVGSMVINYKGEGTVCEFSPTDIDYDANDTNGCTDTVRIEADYDCVGGDEDGQTGTATINMTDRSDQGPRGSIGVDADDDDLDITGSAGCTDEENTLKAGNVIIEADFNN
jgi:hypothetical protein